MIIHNRKSGQGLVEYALILSLVALVVVTALTLLSGTIEESYMSTIPNAISNAMPGLST